MEINYTIIEPSTSLKRFGHHNIEIKKVDHWGEEKITVVAGDYTFEARRPLYNDRSATTEMWVARCIKTVRSGNLTTGSYVGGQRKFFPMTPIDEIKRHLIDEASLMTAPS